jgi:hypothetical protein
MASEAMTTSILRVLAREDRPMIKAEIGLKLTPQVGPEGLVPFIDQLVKIGDVDVRHGAGLMASNLYEINPVGRAHLSYLTLARA